MKRNFLLLLLLTLLPLAGWAQSYNWDPSAPNLKYGDAVPADALGDAAGRKELGSRELCALPSRRRARKTER